MKEKNARISRPLESSGAWQGATDGVATLKVRKSAFDALNKGSGALGKRSKVVAPSGAPPQDLYVMEGGQNNAQLIYPRERPKCDDDNWEPHLVDHQMLHGEKVKSIAFWGS